MKRIAAISKWIIEIDQPVKREIRVLMTTFWDVD